MYSGILFVDFFPFFYSLVAYYSFNKIWLCFLLFKIDSIELAMITFLGIRTLSNEIFFMLTVKLN